MDAQLATLPPFSGWYAAVYDVINATKLYAEEVPAAARIGAGSRGRLALGNLSIHRDWGWAPTTSERCGECSSASNLTTSLLPQVSPIRLRNS